MAIPWLRVIDTVLGLTDQALSRRAPPSRHADEEALMAGGAAAPIEARLTGVMVAALKEVFNRDNQRLELEREQLNAERERAERALRLELRRQAGEREIGRLRLVAGVAAASWLGTLFFSGQLIGGSTMARVALGFGWLLLLAALGASFAAQGVVGRSLAETNITTANTEASSGSGGAMAPWLIIAGLLVIGIGVLVK